MKKTERTQIITTEDPTAGSRKKDHIELAFQSQVQAQQLDDRFYYEPMLAGHPVAGDFLEQSFLGRELRAPIWVSSMTGGTEWARTINHNLARVCGEFGMGMGLGSCRSLLYSDEHFEDFNVRALMGDDLPLYANLGIAQLEELLDRKNHDGIRRLIDRLRADGLIVHVNPLQEWLQPEGDRFKYPPLDTIQRLLDVADFPIIVKEVGQGMGYHSLKALLQLPLAAVDFAANGGTNFARLELLRNDAVKQQIYGQLANVGHSAEEMVRLVNRLKEELSSSLRCREIIISGGVRSFLDGYYLTQSLALPSIYGQASGFLRHARGSYEELQTYVAAQIEGLQLAHALLRIKPAPKD